jgi:hypothetical protein
MNFEEFVGHWQNKPESLESKLARNYKRAVSVIESLPGKLVKCLRVEKTSKGFIPVFNSEAERLYDEIQMAESRVAEVKADIKRFLALTDGEASLERLSEKLTRARRMISDVEFEASIALERAIRQNRSLTPREAEHLGVVQTAFDKRDRVKAEFDPVIMNTKDRLSKAKEILEKYAST